MAHLFPIPGGNMRVFRAVALLWCLLGVAAAQQEIPWEDGPTVGKLGDVAEITVPEGYRFTGAQGARMVMELTQNPTSGRELGVLVPNQENDIWFVVFEFDPIGYVENASKEELDAEAILTSLQKGTEASNEERKRRGWEAFHVVGWSRSPFYNPTTNNLTWAIRGKGDNTPTETINYSVRVLGRKGTMNVDLVISSEQSGTVIPVFENLLGGFQFKTGNRYADFVSGDKVAAVGLTALVAGGAGAVAAQTGLLSKFWKLIVAAFVAIGAALKKLWGTITGKKKSETGMSANA
jgi:uncharacterized membrane-anchored protein